jgi:hypothetical protein
MSTTEINETVHEGQAAILQSDARFRIVACGRRWGKTVTCAKEVRDSLLTHADGWLAWWVAPTYQQAEIGLRTLLDETPEEFIESVNRSKLRVDAVTGATVEFKSADKPDNLRGEGVDLLVADEAAEIDQYAYENALRPTLTDSEDSRMIAISTPKGRGWFFEFYQRGKSTDWPEYEAFQGPTRANPFINQSDVTDAKRELPERVFRQEYLAEFVDETGGVFEDLDDTLFTDDYDLPLPPAEAVDPETVSAEPPYATGVDFARHQDFRVALTLDGAGRVVHFEREQGETWPQIHRAVCEIAEQYPGVVAVDASRDNKIVADLEADGVAVEPVKFSPQRKRELIENLMAAIENAELTAPEIPTLRTELEVFEYDVTRGGNVRYDAPSGFHDDCVDALALAVDARTEAARQNVATTARAGGKQQYNNTDGDAIREAVSKIQQQYRDTTGYKG